MVIELTNKCNLNCFYCERQEQEPKELDRSIVLSMVRNAVENGERCIDFAGGEPLFYPDVENLIQEVKNIPGVEKVTLTTNGILLPGKLQGLQAAGIDGINIHLDSGDAWTYVQITGKEMVLNEVLNGLWSALARDIPVALSIMMHEQSKDSFVVLASFAKKMPIDIRFVSCSTFTEEAGLNEEKVVKKLSRHFKDLQSVEDHIYQSAELKGRIIFSNHLPEAFA